MCGIIGYIGREEAWPILIRGLKRLEYRGYDSAGVAVLGERLHLHRVKGKVSDLEKSVREDAVSGRAGIGHTRWATHGLPESRNAHPHRSMHGHFLLVHNGIIENHVHLRERLMARGYRFTSDTDSEVIVNLIEYIYLKDKIPAALAMRLALKKLTGTYGLAILCTDEPHRLFAVRRGSPLVIGIGEKAHYLASDTLALRDHTDKVVFPEEDQLVILEEERLLLLDDDHHPLRPHIETLDEEIGEVEKGDFPHYMLKEIFEQPAAIRDTIRGRIPDEGQEIHLGGLFPLLPLLKKAERIIIVGCGTSWHAALIGEYLFEEFARIPVEVEYASEFRYRHPVIRPGDLIVAISQSGETADTLAAIRQARQEGAKVLGICNVVGASIPRETDAGVYTHAGPEIGVASTKAFTAQVTVLAMIALWLAKARNTLDDDSFSRLVRELREIPGKIRKILDHNHEPIKDLARQYQHASNFLYLGRGYSFPVALEGALKMKEISYIHAEGYPAAEMKHGPIALIDENMPVVFIAPRDNTYDKILSNIREVKARRGKIIAIVNEEEKEIRQLADHLITVPSTLLPLSPLLTVVPLQLLAYHIAVLRGCDVDQPRNLAKSVTVE